jgi:hypothetical protein
MKGIFDSKTLRLSFTDREAIFRGVCVYLW